MLTFNISENSATPSVSYTLEKYGLDTNRIIGSGIARICLDMMTRWIFFHRQESNSNFQVMGRD
jgi:hypothetical protein